MTVDEVVALQAAQGLGHVHVVWLGDRGFAMAHTDYERAMGAPLEMCRIHQWLTEHPGPPAPVGVYIISAHEPDGYSESYRSDPWELHRL